MERLALSTLSDSELETLLNRLDAPAWRARQLREACWQPYSAGFADVRQLPRALRTALEDQLAFSTVQPRAEHETDAGATVKLLCALGGDATVEAVAMETPAQGRSKRRSTVCVSTQVGCAVGCPFCATGRLGLRRNCTAAEIVDQVRAAATALHRRGLGPVTHVVYMGMGEPLANLSATLRSLQVLTTHGGLSARRITVSTSGVVPAIRRFASAAPPVTLAVSLHAATDALRDRLLPLNRRHPIAELSAAAREYTRVSGRRLSLEWCLIGGVNDMEAQAIALRRIAAELGAHVNVIPMNRIAASAWGPPEPHTTRRFLGALSGVPVTVRDTRGDDIAAACGQLRAELEARREQRPDGSLTAPRRLVTV